MLQEFAMVGLTERFDESVCLLASLLGVSRPTLSSDPHATGARHAPIPPDLAERWSAYTEHDEVLYAQAGARLDADVARNPVCAV